MFNAQKPSLDELPSSAQLIRSTIIAAVSAVVILVTIVLPAEYNIDPTGIGRAIGLAEMGEIKSQLADEAEADRLLDAASEDQSTLLGDILGIFVGPAAAQDSEAEDYWRDQTTFTLAPGDSIEWKLVMKEGETAEYFMTVEGGRVNSDLHGHSAENFATYEKLRGSTGSEGAFTAEFDGEHGWFWRNRDEAEVTVTVKVRGEYTEVAGGS